jgi:hypothetical protein
MMRTKVSVDPPAGNPMTQRTGRDGNSCAEAGPISAIAPVKPIARAANARAARGRDMAAA